MQSELLAFLSEEAPATEPADGSLPTGGGGGGRFSVDVLTEGRSMVGPQPVAVEPTKELSAHQEHFPQHSPSPSFSSSDTSSMDGDFCESLLNPVPEVALSKPYCEQTHHIAMNQVESLSLYNDCNVDSILPDFESLDSLDLESFLCAPTPLFC